MSSGSPSQTVHEVGGPVRGRPSSFQTGTPSSLACKVVERAVERGPGRVLPRRQPRLDLLERERVVAEIGRRRLEVRERGLAGLVVALDRRTLAEAGDAVVAELDLDDVVLVARLARDHERLGELQGGDPGGQLHRRNPIGTIADVFTAIASCDQAHTRGRT